jgi:hypothetical protein
MAVGKAEDMEKPYKNVPGDGSCGEVEVSVTTDLVHARREVKQQEGELAPIQRTVDEPL